MHRLGFRLALGLAGLLILSYLLFPLVHELSIGFFAPSGSGEGLAVFADPEDAQLLPRHDLVYLAHELLIDARPNGPGRWEPELEMTSRLEACLARFGQTYAWLSADAEVIACSEGLPFGPGDELEGGFSRPDLATAGSPFDGIVVGRTATEIWKEGEFAGWLVVYGRPPLMGQRGPAAMAAAADSSGRVVVPRDRYRRWSARTVNLVALVFFGALALLLSFAVSRLVTRRVTRLASEASALFDDPANLPGPFDESGHDEIATLARSLNALRGHVEGLLADLERRDLERRRWIAQVSHDLRTPLTALTACLERAESGIDGEPADLRETLRIALYDAERLRELIEDLLDIARLEADDTLVTEPVPPGELMRQAARGLSALGEHSNLTLEVDIPPGLPELSADGHRLMRALENLLRNALHHARSGVRLTAVDAGAAVRFEVRDDGPGFAGDEGARIGLEGLADRRSRPDSAGLGLVVVRRVAEVHGGESGAENAPGGGARVWFSIPVRGVGMD